MDTQTIGSAAIALLVLGSASLALLALVGERHRKGLVGDVARHREEFSQLHQTQHGASREAPRSGRHV